GRRERRGFEGRDGAGRHQRLRTPRPGFAREQQAAHRRQAGQVPRVADVNLNNGFDRGRIVRSERRGEQRQSGERGEHVGLPPGVRKKTPGPGSLPEGPARVAEKKSRSDYRAISIARVSRSTVTRISPGKVISSETRLAISWAMR